mgnify:CR=1 FL=1
MWKIGMPNLGHTMESGRIIEWLKAEGDAVAPGDALAVVETDKVTVDVEAPAAGLLLAVMAPAGSVAPVGATIALVGQPDEAEAAAALARAARDEPAPQPTVASPAPPPPPPAPAPAPAAIPAAGGRRPVSPAARRRAGELGIDPATVAGTGEGGLVTVSDIERAAGMPVVLLHGFGAAPSLFAPLAARWPGPGRLLTPALPGHEGGATLPGAPDVPALAAALADALPPDGPLVLGGHSLGAAVAVALAGVLGARVAGLLLIAPPGLGAAIDTGFLDDFLAGADPDRAERALARLVADPRRIAPRFRAETLAQMSDPARRAPLARIAEACLSPDARPYPLREALARLSCPVRILWGRADHVLPAPAPGDVPEGADLTLLAGAGHLLPVERPAALAAALAAFITENAEAHP